MAASTAKVLEGAWHLQSWHLLAAPPPLLVRPRVLWPRVPAPAQVQHGLQDEGILVGEGPAAPAEGRPRGIHGRGSRRPAPRGREDRRELGGDLDGALLDDTIAEHGDNHGDVAGEVDDLHTTDRRLIDRGSDNHGGPVGQRREHVGRVDRARGQPPARQRRQRIDSFTVAREGGHANEVLQVPDLERPVGAPAHGERGAGEHLAAVDGLAVALQRVPHREGLEVPDLEGAVRRRRQRARVRCEDGHGVDGAGVRLLRLVHAARQLHRVDARVGWGLDVHDSGGFACRLPLVRAASAAAQVLRARYTGAGGHAAAISRPSSCHGVRTRPLRR